MSLYYSNGSLKNSTKELHYSNGSSKLPIKELYYSNGSGKQLIWSTSYRPPISNLPYMIMASTSATYDNGIIQVYPSNFNSLSQSLTSGDFKGFVGFDYWGNSLGASRNMGDNRYNYLVLFLWNSQTSKFTLSTYNSSTTTILTENSVFDPLTQWVYQVVSNNYLRIKPTSINPTSTRAYTKIDSSYIKVSPVISISPTSGLGAFGGEISNRSMFFVSNSTSSTNVYHLYKIFVQAGYTTAISCGVIPEASAGGKVIMDYYTDGLTSEKCVIFYTTNSSSNSSTRAYYYDGSTLTLAATLSGAYVNSYIGYTNDFNQYILYVYFPASSAYKAVVFDFTTKTFFHFNTVNTFSRNIVPQVSAQSNYKNYGLQFLNTSGSYQNYTGDVVWTSYTNTVQESTKTFTQQRFTSNALTFDCNTPYLDYYKDADIVKKIEATL